MSVEEIEQESVPTIVIGILRMSKPLSLFNSYNQPENRTTNYCGLMLKLVYEESPRLFGELMADIIPADASISIGPTFTQQYKAAESTPDLVIAQQAFTIAVEAKRDDWHYSDQVKRHLEGLKGRSGTKVLLLLSNAETDTTARVNPNDILTADKGIIVATLTYERLLDALTDVCKSDRLSSMLSEFRIYLDENSLLPSWKSALDVVNCGRTLNELAADVFFCPDTGGPYSHRRARWFGAYWSKEVHSVHAIDAVVVVGRGGNIDRAEIKWKNNQELNDGQLITKAVELVNRFDSRSRQINDVALQVFLLGDKALTSFAKESGGIRTKAYLYNERFNTQLVKDMTWILENELRAWPYLTK